jgi:DNA ligase-1
VPITDEQLEQIQYPVCGSPKYDGIRALCTGESVLSSSLKPLGNQYIQECLSYTDYAGLDGELIVSSPTAKDEFGMSTVFNTTTGAVRRADGKPNFLFYIFDDFSHPGISYEDRWLKCKDSIDMPYVVIAEQRILTCPQDVIDFDIEMCELGYEGAMIRRPGAPYKEGRATFKEEIGFKRKPVLDDEAIIIGFEEANENCNEKTTNELGTSKRSSHKENLVPKGTLGAFILKSDKWKEPFNCGTGLGLTEKIRQEIWDNQDKWLGKLVTYKYQGYGSLDKPRQPIFKGERLVIDQTTY